MRIAIFSNLYYPDIIGGAEMHCQILSEKLASLGVDIRVYTTADPSQKKKEERILNGVRIVSIPEKNIYWNKLAADQKSFVKIFWHLLDMFNVRSFFDILGIIKKYRPDIMWTNNIAGFSCSVWAAGWMSGIPIVHTVHDYYLVCYKSIMFKNGRNCTKICLSCRVVTSIRKLLSRKVGTVIGISNYIVDLHKNKGCFGKKTSYCVYHNMIEKVEKKITQELGDASFGYIGRLDHKKGIELLLLASKELELPLRVFGKGNADYEEYLKKSYASDLVRFEGFAPHETIFASISVVIIPSLWMEPFGRGVIEANSFGLPVIASNVGGLQELVIHGENGYLFESGNVFDLKEKIKLMIDNFNSFQIRANEMRENTQKTFGEAVFRNHLALFQQVFKKVN